MDFEWDPKKAQSNRDKYGISFESAAQILLKPTIESIDDSYSYGETRWRALGEVQGTVLVVIYTEPNEQTIRLISAWKATAHDRRKYYEGLFGRS
ncbi:MAG: BrnT family toxin [Pseudomonadota bacterium]